MSASATQGGHNKVKQEFKWSFKQENIHGVL